MLLIPRELSFWTTAVLLMDWLSRARSQSLPATPLDFNLETGLSFPDPLGAIGNLCGLPALSVPCGFTEKHLPIGLQFVARAGDDFGVILAGRTFQSHTDWHRRHPRLA